MGKKLWGWLALAAIVVLVIVYAMKGGNDIAPVVVEEETGPIVVGGIAPLTGDGAAYGLPAQRAVNLAVEAVNLAGGVNGRMLEVVWEDAKCNGTDATTATQKLLNVDAVDFIFGGACSSETLAAATLTQQARALLISGLSSSPDITNAGDLVFRTYPSDAFAGKLLATYATKELGASRAAVLSENTDFAQALRSVFTTSFAGEVVVDETFETGETDFRTIATKVAEANVDVVYLLPQTVTPAQLLLKQLRDLGVNAAILGDDPMLDRTIIADNAPLFEGVILPELAINTENPATAAMFAAYQSKYGVAPEFPSFIASTYDAVFLVAEGMKAVGPDAEKVANYFNTQVNDWKGVVGTFNFDENGDALLQLNLRKIVDGAVTDLGPYTF